MLIFTWSARAHRPHQPRDDSRPHVWRIRACARNVLQLQVTPGTVSRSQRFPRRYRRLIDHALRIDPHLVVIVNPTAHRSYCRVKRCWNLSAGPRHALSVDETYMIFHSARSLEPKLALQQPDRAQCPCRRPTHERTAAPTSAPEPIVLRLASRSLHGRSAARSGGRIEPWRSRLLSGPLREPMPGFQALESLCAIRRSSLFRIPAPISTWLRPEAISAAWLEQERSPGVFIRHCDSMTPVPRQFCAHGGQEIKTKTRRLVPR